jgi:chemotaxis protein MotB
MTIRTKAATATLFLAACVPQGQYDAAIRSADGLRGQLATQTTRLNDAQTTQATLRKQLADAKDGGTSLQKQLDDATAVDDQLSKELKKLGENAQSLLAANGALKGALDGSQRRLEELRRAQAAAEARAALYRDLAAKLKGMVDSGDLAITLRDGRMVLRLPNDVLFDSGRANLKPTGKRALSELAPVLAAIPGRRYQVAGHTDNEPIRLSPFKSNWDLSTARALEVTDFLVAQHVDPRVLSAAGYGEFDPVDANDGASGKAHNRRTEIALQPNIDEIVAIPDEP